MEDEDGGSKTAQRGWMTRNNESRYENASGQQARRQRCGHMIVERESDVGNQKRDSIAEMEQASLCVSGSVLKWEYAFIPLGSQPRRPRWMRRHNMGDMIR